MIETYFNRKFREQDEKTEAIEKQLPVLCNKWGVEAVKEILTWAADCAKDMGPNEFEWVAYRLESHIEKL